MYKPEQLKLESNTITTVIASQTVHTITHIKTNKVLLRTPNQGEVETWLQANLLIDKQTAQPNILRNAVVRALLSPRRT